MKKDYIKTPKNIVSNNGLSVSFSTDDNGELVGIDANCEINYGESGGSVSVDILSSLNSGDKKVAQNFYNKLMSKLNDIVMG